MIIDRRSALKQLLFISAGFVLLPSCMPGNNRTSVKYNNFSIEEDSEYILEELTETIIPATSTPGARDLGVHVFALKMLDDCTSKEDQKKFFNGLDKFKTLTSKEFGKSFVELTAQQKEQLLNKLEAAKDESDDLSFFYRSIKNLTVSGYNTSEYYLSKVQKYELVPGRYNGCVPVKASVKQVS